VRKRNHRRRPVIFQTKGTQTDLSFGTGTLRFKQTIRVIREVRCYQPLNFGSGINNRETQPPSQNEPNPTENEMDNEVINQLCSEMMDLTHTPSQNWDMEPDTAWFEKND
jgi:hypothetical protein